MSDPLKLTDLPNEVLQQVFSYLTYDEIAKNRMVCCKFNQTCEQLLNRGFITMERRHSEILKKVKALLPRRESERRVHQLARHSDILTAIETRISMLRMTFMKYVELNYCCFIPGKVIDEILRILEIVQETCTPPRTHEVLQELRDISSMAMEHFDEKIAPQFKMLRCVPTFLPSPVLAPMPELLRRDTFRKDMKIIKRRSLLHKQQIFVLKNVVSKLVAKVRRQNTTIHSQTMRLREQSSKLKEQDTCIAELKRHVEEWDLKFADLVAELTRAREETSSNTSKTSTSSSKFTDFISELSRRDESSKKPHTSISCTPKTSSEFDTSLLSISSTHSSTPRLYKSNIKPRMAQILPKSLSMIDLPNFEIERKRKLPSSANNIPSKISRLQYQYLKKGNEANHLSILHDSLSDLSSIPNFLSSSLKSILNAPISSIKSRKRKLQ